MNFSLRPYKQEDELGWMQCRVLAFLQTAFYDDVYNEKETYANPSIELVAICDEKVVGLIDVECELEPKSVCSATQSSEQGLAAMIWHVAVHPDYRRQGIAQALLGEAVAQARSRNIERFEAWTRDDEFVNAWYRGQGFTEEYSYYHLMPTQEEINRTGLVTTTFDKTYPLTAYVHYLGDDPTFLSQFKRVHECRRYDLDLERFWS